MKKTFLIVLSLLIFVPRVGAQQAIEKTLKEFNPHDELISMSANLSFNSAIELLNKISEKKSGKKIISLVKRDLPIGVEIINVPYEKALLMIVQYAGLLYEKKEDVTVVKSKVEPAIDLKSETYSDVDGREVKISAIFFELDVNATRSRGINWQYLLNNKAGSIGAGVNTTSAGGTTSSSSSGTTTAAQTSDFTLSSSNEFGLGGLFGQATSMFRYFETENLGEILASPSIVVRNRALGNIQVGSDFSIKQKDFAGNVVDQFFSTGSIIKVTPYIYEQENIDYVLLDLNVERSSGFPSALSTEVRKTTAKTQILMLDGEETVIGGLYLNEDSKVRTGIPFLKDLPWWVLGIRYLTGSDETSLIKKELVIVVKVELLPKLRDRLAFPSDGVSPVKKEVENMRGKLKFYKFNSVDTLKDK